MLAFFLKQDVNNNVEVIIKHSSKPTSTVIKQVLTSNDTASKVVAIEREAHRLNNLESYIEECQKFYGQDYQKEIFAIQLAERPAKLEVLKQDRDSLVRQSKVNPAILPINRLVSVPDYPMAVSILSVVGTSLDPIKEQIEPSLVGNLFTVVESHYSDLSLLEIAHVLKKFVTGEIKVYGKVSLNDVTTQLYSYKQEKERAILEQAESEHLAAKQSRSHGDLMAAMSATKERLQRMDNHTKDQETAKRFATVEKMKQQFTNKD